MPKANEWSRYTKLTDTSKQRIIAASFGEVGTLKTSFWLTTPAPIVIHSTDKGLEGVVDVYLKQYYELTGQRKDIYRVEYDPCVGIMGQDEAITIRDKFEDDWAHTLKYARSTFWDKETQVYEIFKYAEFGAPSDTPSNYYALDQRYRHVINLAKDTDINFGLIQSMKTPWAPKVNKRTGAEGAAPTKGRERRGMREIEELVHLNLEHVWNGEAFQINIGKSRGPGGRDIQNQTIDYVEFPTFAQLVFPDSQETDWV